MVCAFNVCHNENLPKDSLPVMSLGHVTSLGRRYEGDVCCARSHSTFVKPFMVLTPNMKKKDLIIRQWFSFRVSRVSQTPKMDCDLFWDNQKFRKPELWVSELSPNSKM